MHYRYLIVCTLLLALAVPVAGAASFQAGGDRLVDTQNTDGGWGWPLSGNSAANTIGPIGMGLAQAYLQTNDGDQFNALERVGGFLLGKTNNFSPSDGYLAYQLDAIFGGTTYTNHVVQNFYDPLAAGNYDRNGAGTLYSAETYIDRIQTGRSGASANLATWDIGMGLYAASLVGADTAAWTQGVLDELNELSDGNYDVIGLAGALMGLASLDTPPSFTLTGGFLAGASSLQDLADALAGFQLASGGFTWNQNYLVEDDGNEVVQETAYAVLALAQFDRVQYASVIQNAQDYLLSVQLATGGWEGYSGSGENNEITGEALWALAQPAPVPEPATMGLLGLGLAGLAIRGIRRKRVA